jgi:hypothetical protein
LPTFVYLGKIDGEAVGVIEAPGDVARQQLAGGEQLADGSVQQLPAPGQRLQELRFLLVDDVNNRVGVFPHLVSVVNTGRVADPDPGGQKLPTKVEQN